MVDRNYFCELILQSGNSILAAAKAMGVSRNWFYDHRNDKACNVDQLEKLADYLNVSVDSLLQRKQSVSTEYIDDVQIELLKSQIKILEKLLSSKKDTLKSYVDNNKVSE